MAAGAAAAANLDGICALLPLHDTPETAALFICGGIIGGLLPDIDNPASHAGRLAFPLSKLFSEGTGKNHRGILHDPSLYSALAVLSYFFLPAALPVLFGCLTHLLLDAFNPAGLPFLLGRGRIRLGSVPCGGAGASVITALFTALAAFAGIYARLA